MKKVELVDSSEFLQETEKAINVTYNHVEKLRRSASPQDKLNILKRLLPEVKDYAQFQELSKERELLEFEIRHENQMSIIPTEHKSKIISNCEIEVGILDNKLNEYYKILDTLIREMETSLVPLLTNIYRLEKRKDLARSLNKYVEGIYYRVPPTMRIEMMYGFDSSGILSSIATERLSIIKKFIEDVKKEK
ncbi:hypothetical protein [Lysinibacillus sp.]|uniref:hypothetical protein n=1 Tax=Lysinibacillus sp. TaxID=1869345 RepID=UPI0028ADF4B1|nr:hypothetical protein [Lysinibacillus sp.]